MNINDYAFSFINSFNNVINFLGQNGQPAYLNLEGFIAREFAGNKDCGSAELSRARILMYLIVSYLNIVRNNLDDLSTKYDQYIEMSTAQLVANCFLNTRTVENGMAYLYKEGYYDKCRVNSYKGRKRIRLNFKKLEEFLTRVSKESTTTKNEKLKDIREYNEAIKEADKKRRKESMAKWDRVNAILKLHNRNKAIELLQENGFTKGQSNLLILLCRSIYTYRHEFFKWDQIKFNTLMSRLNDKMLPESLEKKYLEQGVKYPAIEELTNRDLEALASSCMPENDYFHEDRLLDTILMIYKRGNFKKYYEGPESLNWEEIN